MPGGYSRRKGVDMEENVIGKRIKKKLDEYQISQRDLAKTVGTTEVSMSRYVHSPRIPDAIILGKIALALHCSSDYLLGIEK